MDPIIDELWETLYQTCPIMTREWLNCFDNHLNEAKSEITSTLNNNDAWKDPSGNFLLRLVSDGKNGYSDSNGKYKPRVQLALAFVHHMSQSPDFTDFILSTLAVVHGRRESNFRVGDGVDQNDGSARLSTTSVRSMKRMTYLGTNEEKRGNGILHEAAKSGLCADLEQFLSETNVNAPNNIGETALHLAAEFEHSQDVEILLRAGATIEVTLSRLFFLYIIDSVMRK